MPKADGFIYFADYLWDFIKAHPVTWPVILFFVLVVIGIFKGFDREDVKWIVKRYCNIIYAQAKDMTREFLGHIAVLAVPIVLSLMIGGLLFHAGDGALFDLDYSSGDAAVIPVTTITTTMFATLMSIILALVALAVTAYVFLNDALSGRNECERSIVLEMKESTRRRLFSESVFSGICVIAILIVDNADLRVLLGGGIAWARYAVLTAGLLDVVLLLFFISAIVNYEKRLLSLAQSYININGKKLVAELKEPENADNELVDPAEIIKNIGDLEMLLSSILSNHESEYRFQKGLTSAVMLKEIIKRKQPYAGEETTETGINDLYESSRKLIELRNCLWVLQNAGWEPKVQKGLNRQVSVICQALKQYAFRDERFMQLNFNATDFSGYCFEKTAFRDSAFVNVDFSGARLQETDFSSALLQKPNFKGANCAGAVFKDARFISPMIDNESDFSKAVFEDCDLSIGDKETIGSKEQPTQGDSRGLFLFQFSQIMAHRARFMHCFFSRVDFSESVFAEATFSSSILIACNFYQSDLSNAVMVHTMLGRSCDFRYAKCTGLKGAYSSWGALEKKDETGNTDRVDYYADNDAKLDLTGSRFERANLAEAILTECCFHKAYLNYASFNAAVILGCDFSDAFLKSVDFTDCVLENCQFDRAFLSDTLIIGEAKEKDGDTQTKDSRTIIGTSFKKTDMQGCSIRNHRFKDCSFDETILNDASIRDVEFEECSFKNAHFNGAMLFNVTWINCKNPPRTDAMTTIEFGTSADEYAWNQFWRTNS